MILNEMGHELQPAMPSVVVGDNHRIKHLVDGKCIVVRFKTNDGFFSVEAIVNN